MRRPRVRATRATRPAGTRSRPVPLVSDRFTGDVRGKHGNRRGDPGPFRFDPTPRQTPSIRHRAAADPARRRGRATGKIAGRIIVATDDRRIADAVAGFGGEVVMTRADHATGTDRVAEVAARLGRRPDHRQPPGRRARGLRRGARPGRRAARGRPRGADGHAGDADPRRGDLSRPGVRQGRLLGAAAAPCTSRGARSPAIATASPIPRRRRGRSPISTWASTPIAATSCCRSPRSPLPRSRPPRSSSSSASSKPAIPIAVGIVEEPSVGIDTPEDYRRFVERWRSGSDS